ncbi:MAG: hypothetical protein EKK55_24340 [Rhodocyclaceae bacterium]|nr:MAG: hypothetical protein EKK55_24340 [Rhodocyclaceae bacterium]
MPMTTVCPAVQGPAERASFDACPAFDLERSGELLDLWHACGGRIEALVAVIRSPSAGLIDAFAVIAAEMDRLHAVLRERAKG